MTKSDILVCADLLFKKWAQKCFPDLTLIFSLSQGDCTMHPHGSDPHAAPSSFQEAQERRKQREKEKNAARWSGPRALALAILGSKATWLALLGYAGGFGTYWAFDEDVVVVQNGADDQGSSAQPSSPPVVQKKPIKKRTAPIEPQQVVIDDSPVASEADRIVVGPEGYCAVVRGKTVTIKNAADEEVASFDLPDVDLIQFSPDRTRLAAASKVAAVVWSIDQNSQVSVGTVQNPVSFIFTDEFVGVVQDDGEIIKLRAP